MSYPLNVKAIICYIEAHIKDEKFSYNELERCIGFSNAYIRELFSKNAGCSLAKYVRMRKVKCSAYELLYTDMSIIDIAYLYGFSNPETYTRAFNKIIGMTPSTFRSSRPIIGKEELFVGVYGIGLLKEKEQRSDIFMDKNVYKNNTSTILYGVPKVAFGEYGGCTPYPICLKACSEYLGEDLEYYFTMVIRCFVRWMPCHVLLTVEGMEQNFLESWRKHGELIKICVTELQMHLQNVQK